MITPSLIQKSINLENKSWLSHILCAMEITTDFHTVYTLLEIIESF